MLAAALNGQLSAVPFRNDSTFSVAVPTICPGVPSSVLDPRAAWADKTAYDEAAADLASQFQRALARNT